MPVLVVGSIALDHIKTPTAEHHQLLGGSASYAAVAASFFGPVRLVGVIGDDFPPQHRQLFVDRKIDLAGLEVAAGQTFCWSGEYEMNMNNRRTLSVALNVFETFQPKLPENYRETPYVLLGNIAPSLQRSVCHQIRKPKFVVADTMDLWIGMARADLLELLKEVDMLILNDSEARQLTEEDNIIRAGRKIAGLGPRYVAVKKGEHGCLLFGRDGEFFSTGAFPLDAILRPARMRLSSSVNWRASLSLRMSMSTFLISSTRSACAMPIQRSIVSATTNFGFRTCCRTLCCSDGAMLPSST